MIPNAIDDDDDDDDDGPIVFCLLDFPQVRLNGAPFQPTWSEMPHAAAFESGTFGQPWS